MRYLTLISACLLHLVYARVTFPNSEVLQAPDIAVTNKATFKCKNQCKVYVDRMSSNLYVSQNGKLITNFNSIVGGSKYVPTGFLLQPGDYVLENRGDQNPEFVFYIVDTTAPNYGSAVYTPSETMGIAVKNKERYVTILSSYEAMWFSAFTGIFPDGFPRIYATGYDAADDIQCRPVYQARSQLNAQSSWPTFATAVYTIDFGFVGEHNVSVNYRKVDDPPKGAGMSTVYTSPGYVGCSFATDQNYYSKLSTTYDDFALIAERLDINALYYSITAPEAVHLKVNDKTVDLVGSSAYSTSYGRGTFTVSLSWERKTPGSNWAMQLDFGSTSEPTGPPPTGPSATTSDPALTTTTKTGRSFCALFSVLLITATFLSE